MLRSVILSLMILLVSAGILSAQDEIPLEAHFAPVQSLLSFDYPANWISREQARVAVVASDETALSLEFGQDVALQQMQILLVYLRPEERSAANIKGDSPESILQSVIRQSNSPDQFEAIRRFEYNHHISARADLHADTFAAISLVMQMDNDAVVLVQALSAPDDFSQIEATLIALVRTIELDPMLAHILAIPDLARSQQFLPEKTHFTFDYPEGWTVREANATTSVLVNDTTQTQIALQFFPYTDLQRAGIPIDDVSAILQEEQNRSGRAQAFGQIGRLIFKGQTYAYATIAGTGFSGLSLARDVDGIGLLWVSTLAGGDSLEDDLVTLTWALLLKSTYQPDSIPLDKRYILPRYQFEFYYPGIFLSREASSKSLILGTTEAMIDEVPDAALLPGDVQVLIEYVTPEEFSAAGGVGLNSQLYLRSIVSRLPNKDDFTNWRELSFGVLSYTQVDFSTGAYSGTALLSKLSDDGAVWIQLRTAPGELAQWEAIVLEIARTARIVTIRDVDLNTLDYSLFNLLDAQATPVPTPTLAPDAPPRLENLLPDILATPVPAMIRELSVTLPPLENTYTANISHLQVNYGADWFVQELLPESDNAHLWENAIRLSNNANLLLQASDQVAEGQVRLTAQYTTYDEIHTVGIQGDNLLDINRSLVASFPSDRYGTPTAYTVNGTLMVFVPIYGENQQGLSITRELSDAGYVTVQVIAYSGELETWLSTAIAIAQSATISTE